MMKARKVLNFILLVLTIIISEKIAAQSTGPIDVQAVIIPHRCSSGQIILTVTGDAAPFNYLWSDGSTNSTLQNATAGEHSVTILGNANFDTTLYFVVPLEKCRVVFPDIFTPNGDGINDTWNLANIERYPKFTLHVFDRWGNKVHSASSEYDPWNGRNIGSNLPAASYYFVFFYEGSDGEMEKGIVSILR